MAARKQESRIARSPTQSPADAVGIQIPVGRIRASGTRWQTIFDARDKPCIYRIHNGAFDGRRNAGGNMIVEVDGSRQAIRLATGTSVDVLGKKIRVKSGSHGDDRSRTVEGWYVLIS